MPNQHGNHDKLNSIKSAYIHIPFCRRRCFYCDFPISVVGDKARGEKTSSIQKYVDILCQEIELAGFNSSTSLETVFFGGGTPSLLAVYQVEQILKTLNDCLGIIPKAEISLEIDPGTFSLSQLNGYQKAGVNRVSLGVQAFQDELLKISGRSHTSKDIFTAWDIIQQGGITNHSLDLISGLPHQTLEQWQNSLEIAVSLQPKHISCYDLVVESVTPFGKQYAPGIQPLPTDENTAQMCRIAQQILTASGYHHYEICNYAQPGFACNHNQVYWRNQPYWGFGMGATSYINKQRFARPRTRREYYQWVEKGCLIETENISASEHLLETLMLALRLAEGISLVSLQEKFGEDVLEKILRTVQPYIQQGWVIVTEDKYLKFSDPDGFLFSNTVLSTLFNCFDD